jgi:hypothetical protein
MGHLKMLINKCSQEVPPIGLLYGFDVLLHCSDDVFFFFVNNFDLVHLCLWLFSSGFVSHSFLTIPFDVPWLFTVVAQPLLLFIIGDFCDIYVHAIFRMDVSMVSLLIDQLQKVSFLLARVLAVPLG